jgi:hypothetical protein
MSDVAGFPGTIGWPQKGTKSHKKRTRRLGCPIFDQRPDPQIDGQIIVESRCVKKFAPVHQAQLLSPLKNTGLRLGLLIDYQDPKRQRQFPMESGFHPLKP